MLFKNLSALLSALLLLLCGFVFAEDEEEVID